MPGDHMYTACTVCFYRGNSCCQNDDCR